MTQENKSSESDSQQEQPESQRKFSQEQYDLLKRCSEKKDMTEWNEWRKEHSDEEIWLQEASLEVAHLENADLWKAHLENANFFDAHLENADLRFAHLENAHLQFAHLENAELVDAHLENADLSKAYLENAELLGAHLENAFLLFAHLENADLRFAHLENANFTMAIADGATLIWECHIDRKTNFAGVGLGSARIDPQTKQLLEYNIRWMNWEKWYRGKSENKWIIKMRQLLTSPIRAFWWVSNYGSSTWRIILTFLVLSIVFATVYFVWGAVDYYVLDIKDQPGVVSNLFVRVVGEEQVSDVYYSAMVYFRSIYFSIVTMTTLGFGDMYANAVWPDCRWWFGHLLLMVQVILGYILLGALVTRFAVLFTAGGPAGKFSKETKKR